MNLNSSISCLVIEDEPIAQDKIVDYIDQTPSLNLVGTAENAKKAFLLAEQLKPQLIFLDIRMPGMNGIDMLKNWPGDLPLIIITSAYEQYALEGYKFSVIDYLVKPYELEQFSQAVDKVEQRLNYIKPSSADSLNTEFSSLRHILTIKDGHKIVNVPHSTIQYCEANGNYVKIFTTQKTLLPRGRISTLSDMLPPTEFIRISRRYIVRIAEIETIEGQVVLLFNGEKLSITGNYRYGVDYVFKKDRLPL